MRASDPSCDRFGLPKEEFSVPERRKYTIFSLDPFLLIEEGMNRDKVGFVDHCMGSATTSYVLLTALLAAGATGGFLSLGEASEHAIRGDADADEYARHSLTLTNRAHATSLPGYIKYEDEAYQDEAQSEDGNAGRSDGSADGTASKSSTGSKAQAAAQSDISKSLLDPSILDRIQEVLYGDHVVANTLEGIAGTLFHGLSTAGASIGYGISMLIDGVLEYASGGSYTDEDVDGHHGFLSSYWYDQLRYHAKRTARSWDLIGQGSTPPAKSLHISSIAKASPWPLRAIEVIAESEPVSRVLNTFYMTSGSPFESTTELTFSNGQTVTVTETGTEDGGSQMMILAEDPRLQIDTNIPGSQEPGVRQKRREEALQQALGRYGLNVDDVVNATSKVVYTLDQDWTVSYGHDPNSMQNRERIAGLEFQTFSTGSDTRIVVRYLPPKGEAPISVGPYVWEMTEGKVRLVSDDSPPKR